MILLILRVNANNQSHNSFSHVGYFFNYSIEQHYYKENAQEKLAAGIADKLLTAIDVTAAGSEIHWKEEGKEFYVHGKYDVAKMKNVNGRAIIYCVDDKDEGRLIQDLNKVVRSAYDHNADGKNREQNIRFQLSDLLITSKKILLINGNSRSRYFSFNDILFQG